MTPGTGAGDADIAARTDAYFNRTRRIVSRFGDKRVTYALFLRRPVVSAPGLMLDWLRATAQARGAGISIDLRQPEGADTLRQRAVLDASVQVAPPVPAAPAVTSARSCADGA